MTCMKLQFLTVPNCWASSCPRSVDTTRSFCISALFPTNNTCAESQLYVLICVALNLFVMSFFFKFDTLVCHMTANSLQLAYRLITSLERH